MGGGVVYRRSVTAPAVRGQLYYIGALCLLMAILVYHTPALSEGDFIVELAMAACGLFCIGVAYRLGRHIVIIDEGGVRVNIGRRRGHIPWDNVREIGVIRTMSGGEIVCIVSKKASLDREGAARSCRKPSDDVIKVEYNQKLMEAIEQYDSGMILWKKQSLWRRSIV
jgi:hypothetical protein